VSTAQSNIRKVSKALPTVITVLEATDEMLSTDGHDADYVRATLKGLAGTLDAMARDLTEARDQI